jgi:hypothetical protein
MSHHPRPLLLGIASPPWGFNYPILYIILGAEYKGISATPPAIVN